MGLSFAKKAIFFLPKRINFPKIRYKIVQYFDSVHAHKPNFFAITSSRLFFLALLLSLLCSSYILSDCFEKLGVNYSQSVEMDLDQF